MTTEPARPESSTRHPSPERKQHSRRGKYLLFRLGNETYGMDVLSVTEIIGSVDATPVPNTPSYVRGVMNLRGRILPVVDVGEKLGVVSEVSPERPCVIVVEMVRGHQTNTVGLIVEEVCEVVDLEEEQVQDPPSFGCGVDTSFLSGMAEGPNGLVFLLSIDMVLIDVETELQAPGAENSEQEIASETSQ